MHTFARESKTAQEPKPQRTVVSSRARVGQGLGPSLLSHPQPKPEAAETASKIPLPGRSGHDFGRMSVFSTNAANRSTAHPESSGAVHQEQSVEMSGEEEQTVDGGTPTPVPASTACDCIPSSVQIKNVAPYRRGKLYGHEFDVEVALTYSAASGAGSDAQLFWFEKTDRAPSWQGLSANVWNDMFALFPTSPTFDGWTKNRTKPCPGNETATIHDPPAASVDMPARTLEFDIYVKGQNISHNARAKQVLEPDGAGGVKTQTFDILPSALGPLAGP
jgi:hypothetical protein